MTIAPKVPGMAGGAGLVGLITDTALGAHPPTAAWWVCAILAIIGTIWPQNSADRSAVLLRIFGRSRSSPTGQDIDPPDHRADG